MDLPNASGITPLMAAAGVGVSPNTSRAKKKTEATSIEAARLLDRGRSRRQQSHARPAQDSHGSEGPRGDVRLHLPDGVRLRVPSAERQDGVARRGAERLERDGSFSSAERRRAAGSGRDRHDSSRYGDGNLRARDHRASSGSAAARRWRCSTSFVGRMPTVILRLSLPAAGSPRSTSRVSKRIRSSRDLPPSTRRSHDGSRGAAPHRRPKARKSRSALHRPFAAWRASGSSRFLLMASNCSPPPANPVRADAGSLPTRCGVLAGIAGVAVGSIVV